MHTILLSQIGIKKVPEQVPAPFYSIEKINSKGQIAREGHPKQIRYLKPTCYRRYFYEFDNHYYYNKPQNHQPYISKQKCSEIEKHYTPEKVKHKIDSI